MCTCMARWLTASRTKSVPNALIQVWQASTNCMYDQQDPKQMTGNLRGKFYSDKNGEYGFYCLKPTPYPIDPDGKHPLPN